MIIKVVTLGCKVNQCESASIVSTLNSHNYNASEGLAPADVYILNTCSVTAEADKKSRQHVSKMCKLNPDCRIIVVGCSTQNKPHKFEKSNVIAIGSTTDKARFCLSIIDKLYKDNHYNTLLNRIIFDENIEKIDKSTQFCYEKYPKSTKTRAFIKIQDGCNRFCSYCIIPYLRGRSRSRSIDDIVKECEHISSKEVVLTGIDMSMYGKDIGVSFTELLNALSRVKARKRLGSLECEVVDRPMLEAMRDGNYCPHFHLSLQSGSNEVLRTMNRHYDQEFYFEKIELIRQYFPLAGITTDIIVGFPTETDEFFRESCDFIDKCKFSDIHVFPYSSREGTLAARKYKTLPPSIVKERVNVLLDIKSRLHGAFLNQNTNAIMPVYIEDVEDSFNVGYTPNYIKVYSKEPCGEIVDLCLTDKYKDGLFAVRK